MKKALLIIGAILLFAAFTVGKSIFQFAAEEEAREAFTPQINAYLEAADWEALEGEEPYIAGKVVTVDTDKKAVDYWTFDKLPEGLRAKSPTEVGTVVLITWDWEEVGKYQDTETGETTGAAKKSLASVTLLNWQEQLIIEERVFEGQPPPESIALDGDYALERPMFEIVDYLKGLPRG